MIGDSSRIVYRGAKEISLAVGINWKEFNLYVKKYGLPAFKIDNRGTWLATPEKLKSWVIKQQEQYR